MYGIGRSSPVIQGPATAGTFVVDITAVLAAAVKLQPAMATNSILTTATSTSGYAAPYSSNNPSPTQQAITTLCKSPNP